jgi:hypothetical protein
MKKIVSKKKVSKKITSKKKVSRKKVEEKDFCTLLTECESDSERLCLVAPILPKLIHDIYADELFYVTDVKELRQGEIHSYEKDVESMALCVDDQGDSVHETTKGTRMFPAEFLVTAVHKIKLSSVAQRKSSLLDDLGNDIVEKISTKIKNNVIKLLQHASSHSKQTFKFNFFRRVIYFFNNKYIISFIYKGMKKIKTTRNYFMLSTQTKELLLTHCYKIDNMQFINHLKTGKWYDQPIVETDCIPFGEIYYVPEEVVKIRKRVELTALPADQFIFGKPYFGFMFITQISCSLLNTKDVVRFVI